MTSESDTGLKTTGCPLPPPAVNKELLTKDGESKVARSALGVLLVTGAGTLPPSSLVGHPGGSPRLRRTLNLCPLSSAALWLVSRCLFVLGFSPLYTPIPLWEKSTFAFQSLANRRGLYYILMAAPGLQGSDDKSSDVCCRGTL